MTENFDITIIGGGPAGLAAAISASKTLDGKNKVLLVERESRLGGILKQCIHDGFGLIRFGEKLSGCEYATRFIETIQKTNVKIELLTFASKIEKKENGFDITLVNKNGVRKIHTKTIVFSTGCRERTAKQVAIHGSRPSGVLTAGSAQAYINIYGQLPGKRCVILGSGDIGLIMARRLSLEGANVIGVYEAKSSPSGLARNIFQCLNDFDIPLYLSKTVSKVFGNERLEAVEISDVDERMQVIPGTEKIIECDTLILSVGLIPENELAKSLNIAIDVKTKGPICDQTYMSEVPGIFICGNAMHVNDLVDYVSESGEEAGRNAALFAIENDYSSKEELNVNVGNEFLYVVPQKIQFDVLKQNRKATFFFRTKSERDNSIVRIIIDGKEVFSKRYTKLRPPEMQKINIDLNEITENSKIDFVMDERNKN